MICLADNLPPLKVGRQKVVAYQTDWIARSLARAAEAAGRRNCPFLPMISEGVVKFLRNHASLQLLPIEKLYQRMRWMLTNAGCPDIADHLQPLAPPVTVSLIGPARLATQKRSASFFQILDEEIRCLHRAGAEVIRFCDLDEGTSILAECSLMRKSREKLVRDLEVFLKERCDESSFPRRVLHLTLES